MPTTLDPHALASRVLDGGTATPDELLAVLATPATALVPLVAAAGRLRRHHFANTVKVNYLVNLKSGLCPENCSYCSQAVGSQAEILKYSWLSKDEALRQAAAGIGAGATRVCMVSSGRGPSDRDVDKVVAMTEAIKESWAEAEVCACLGLLKDGQAARLRDAGVDAYNHNINTAASHHDSIVTTHTYDDRIDTIGKAKDAGLSPCSGLIAGLGESDEQLVEALLALRDLGADSVPVNFLMPFDGTPFAETWQLTPARCVTILAAARFACPDVEIRIAAGREMHLRTLQGLALEVANSIFLGDYLTSQGQDARADLELLRDHGFVILGNEDAFTDGSLDHVLNAVPDAVPDGVPDAVPDAHAPSGCGSGGASACGSGCGSACGPAGATKPVLRRRGAGTDVPANA